MPPLWLVERGVKKADTLFRGGHTMPQSREDWKEGAPDRIGATPGTCKPVGWAPGSAARSEEGREAEATSEKYGLPP